MTELATSAPEFCSKPNSVRSQPILHYLWRMFRILIMLEYPFFRHKTIRIWMEIVFQYFLIIRAVHYYFNEDEWTKPSCWKYPLNKKAPSTMFNRGYLVTTIIPWINRTLNISSATSPKQIELSFIQKSDSLPIFRNPLSLLLSKI